MWKGLYGTAVGTGQQPTWGWFRAPGSLGPVRPEMTRCIRNDFGRRRKFSKTERDKKKKRGILKFEFDWSTRNRLCCDWLIIISQRRQSTINIYRILSTCNFVVELHIRPYSPKKSAKKTKKRMVTAIPGIFYRPTPSVPHLGPGTGGLWAHRCDPIIDYGFRFAGETLHKFLWFKVKIFWKINSSYTA